MTVRNVETGTVRTVVTEADGQYRVPALLPGRYDVTGELSGFSTVSAPGINLATSQEVRQNLRLTVATLQETITVTAEAPVIEVSKTEVAAVITKEQLEMLPVTNRALVTLSLLLPGTSQDGTRPRRNNAQVGAGTLQFTTLALADGTLNMSTKAGEPRQDFPQAAVREVRVVTSSAPAEFGGRAGGVVSVVTRGGTNAFSGEAYEYFRNEAMDRMDPLTEADLEAQRPGAAALLAASVWRSLRRADHPRSTSLLCRSGADERGGTLSYPVGPSRVLRQVRRGLSGHASRSPLFRSRRHAVELEPERVRTLGVPGQLESVRRLRWSRLSAGVIRTFRARPLSRATRGSSGRGS